MARYGYFQQIQPPAPFVHVVLRNPITGAELKDVPAQLDTAADRSLLPLKLAQGLALPQTGSLLIGGVSGTAVMLPLFPVLLGVHDRPLQAYEVLASDKEDWILLGRDVINTQRLLLDGPQLALEIL
jgi:hypothetical protein